MKVYRVENVRGHGPFEAMPDAFEMADALQWVRAGHEPFEGYDYLESDDTHPHHMLDVPLPDWEDEHDWRVGCKDLDQLHHWFPPHSFPFLAEHGFELVIYECDCSHIHFGTYQILFCVNNITVISRGSLQ